MEYEVDWINRIVFIPASALIRLEGNDYRLLADDFWREIRRLEWEFSEGLWALSILSHNNTRTLAGETYVPENEVINQYQILFDEQIERVFLTGDNNNIVDVFIFNGVVPVSSNSAGNTVTFVDGDGPRDEDCCVVELWVQQENTEKFVSKGESSGVLIENEADTLIIVEETKNSGVIVEDETLKVASCL